MRNPFIVKYNDQADKELIQEIIAGSKEALENLVAKHQPFIYNVALKMCLSPFDAEDITQEVLIKVITHLSQFKGESNFRTWLYCITFNHFLKMKKYWLEDKITTFEDYGKELDNIPNQDLADSEKLELKEYVEDAKIGCMSGMLLCLDREQRLVYVLGEIFGIDHTLGAEMLAISKDNFRQRLARARHDLHSFMNQKCGLVNTNNPCRCDKKTKGFIKAGWVDAQNLKFNTSYFVKIQSVAPEKSEDLCEILDIQYADLFKDHPFQEKDHVRTLMKSVLSDKKVAEIFEW